MIRKYWSKLILTTALFATFLQTKIALAVATSDVLPPAIGVAIGQQANDPRLVAANLIKAAMGLLGLIAVVLILYAGFLWMTAGGNQEKVDKAIKTLKAAVIGLIIILAAYGITVFVINSIISATGG